MMKPETLPPVVPTDDTFLVAQSLAGNQEAFGLIVARYQSLICSLAYSATGSVSGSEDLAQRIFVIAWKRLSSLREPAKLRSWLCRIARNLICDALRDQHLQLTHAAETLDAAVDSPSPDRLPSEQAMSKEEEAILWRSVERIPEIYREPLVLFYREHQSIEKVAQALGLSEDAVKQRLSRGRKLLHEQVLAFVEGALKRTNPGKAFTIGVLAALPAFTVSASAATVGAAAAKGGATAKAAAATSLLGAILAPVLALFGTWVGYRMSLDSSQSDGERQSIRSFYRKLAGCIFGFFIAYALLMVWARDLIATQALLFTALILGLVVAYTVAIFALMIWSARMRRELLGENSTGSLDHPAWEYRSKWSLFGLPLVHIRIGGGLVAQGTPVKAWIAAGDWAIGVLFAFGGVALAPVSIGGLAIGVIPFGGCAVGLLTLGGFAIGTWSFGGLALGWQSFAGCAIAWNAAVGGAAVAHDFALGGVAAAAQANNEVAAAFVRRSWFFQNAQAVFPYLAWLNLIWVIPMLLWWRAVRRASTFQPRSDIVAVAVVTGIFVFPAFREAIAQEVINGPAASKAERAKRFDELVREDFFEGFAGDLEALTRAIKVCEDALAQNTKHAEALVWHGSGLLAIAGKAFESRDFSKGFAHWQQGLEEMNRAVALQPDNVEVRIPRGAALLETSKHTPDPAQAAQLLKTGVADYEKVLRLQEGYFAKLSVHARGELLFGLAEGFHRLGDTAKAQTYFQRVIKDLEGSAYTQKAKKWLETKDAKTLRNEPAMSSCIGCHRK